MDPGERRPLGRRGNEATPAGTPTVTRLGLGCAALGNLYAAVSDRDAADTVEAAFAEGVRFFDTAPLYGSGLSERRLGRALRRRPRDGFVLSTKVGRLLVPRRGEARPDAAFVDALPFEPVFDYGRDAVLRSFEESLARLGTERIDVLLLHDVGARTHGREHARVFRQAMEGYRALDELRRQGRIGAIGLGVNEWEVCLEAFAHADLDCVLLAGRYTLLEQGALESFLPECEKRGVSVIVGGPYNSGLLAADPAPGATYDYHPAEGEVLERARRIRAVCAAHGVAIGAAALQFPLFHPAVAAVIPGARSAAEVRENAARLRAPIPAALWRDLSGEGLLHPAAPAGAPA